MLQKYGEVLSDPVKLFRYRCEHVRFNTLLGHRRELTRPDRDLVQYSNGERFCLKLFVDMLVHARPEGRSSPWVFVSPIPGILRRGGRVSFPSLVYPCCMRPCSRNVFSEVFTPRWLVCSPAFTQVRSAVRRLCAHCYVVKRKGRIYIRW